MSSLYRSILNAQGSSFENLYSFEFDGSTDFISVADADNLSFGNGTTDSPFSISAWVKMTDATRFRIVAKSDFTNGNSEYAFYLDNGDRVTFILYDYSNASINRGREYNVALTPFEGQWIHLLATYNGQGGVNAQNGIKIYLNGTRVDNTDILSGTYVAMPNGNAPLEIGKFLTNRSNGLMDEIAIFNVELSSTEVTNIYNSGVPNDISSLSPVSWWRMGEAANYSGGTWTLTDQGSGGNDGTSLTIPAPPSQPSTDVPT